MSEQSTVQDWIYWESLRRRTNTIYIISYIHILVGAIIVTTDLSQVILTMLVTLCIGLLFQGMTNVVFLLARPQMSGTDEEIREAAMHGPNWFKKLLIKVELQPG